MWIRVQGVYKGVHKVWVWVQGVNMDMDTRCGYGYRVWIWIQGVDMGTGCG